MAHDDDRAVTLDWSGGEFPEDEGRWGRPLRDGVYEARIVACKGHVSGAGNLCLKVTFGVEATAEEAPEGPVKIDHYALLGRASFTELMRAVAPERVGKPGRSDGREFVGRTARITVRTPPEDGGPYPSKPEVKRVAASGRAAAPAAEPPPPAPRATPPTAEDVPEDAPF